jgi:thiamine-phosphate pyrophosphorylase
LTLIAGQAEARPRTVQELAAAAFAGGATALQLRDKGLSDRDLYELAAALAQFCQGLGKLFVINDRLDVALAVGADGLHLGQKDLPLAAARRHWPRPKVLGATAKTAAEAEIALAAGADYLGVGALFPSPSKPEAPLMAQETLRRIQKTPLPLVGVGGIGPENAALAWSYGLVGLAVVSGLAKAPDPAQAARLILAARP